MPQPTRSDVHVDKPLTNISIAYMQKLTAFIADKVFPILPVQKQSDRYFVYTPDNWYRTEAKKRAPATESAGSGFAIDNTPTYFCDLWAIHKDIDDQIRANADEPINMDRDATEFVTRQLLIRREKEFVTKFFNTSIWTGSTTGTDITPGTKWDAALGDPMKDVETQKSIIIKKTGIDPNILVITRDVLGALKNNAAVKDAIKYTQKAVITLDILAGLFDVEKVLVAEAIENTAVEGATKSMNYIAGTQKALLVYAENSPGILKVSGGYTFGWQGLFGAGNAGNRIKRFRMEQLESDRVEGEMAFDQKLIAPDVGAFFTSVLT